MLKLSMVTPRLLITDDDRHFRQSLAEVFRSEGLEVQTAGDGDEAIRIVGSSPVHLVLVDVHMPRVGGLDVIRYVHEHNRLLPCILMSAALTEAIEREAKRMMAYRILSKPLRLATLRDAVLQGLSDVYGWKAG